MEGYEYTLAEQLGEFGEKANIINPWAMIAPSSTENVGIAVRTIKEFFRQREKIKDHMKKQFSFYVSFFQIYNERVYDLLNFNTNGGNSPKSGAKRNI